jgi:hypothetical protein
MSRPEPRLKVGERVLYDGAVYRVALVNACRAHLVLCGGEREHREFEARGERVAFDAWAGRRFLDVSPCSILPRVREKA